MRLSPLTFVVPLLLVACTEQGEEITFDDSSLSSSESSESFESSFSFESSPASPVSLASSVAPASATHSIAAAPHPSHISLDVPFATQAPLGNWDMPYQEACEEASLILVQRFLNEESITPGEMDREILAMVDWQTRNSMDADITAAQMVQTAEQYLNHKAEVRYDDQVTIEAIEQELAKGNPVILPLAGRDINNPYFSGEGPWYHVLVVTGYDTKNFITNDVGTKRGEGYAYRKDILFDAIHDWTGIKEEIRSGRKAMVVVTR